MTELYTIDVIGFWLGIFLTFCILSFLYKDNPFYKFAEHLFVGVSIGYIVAQQYYNVLRPKVIDPLVDGSWSARAIAAGALFLVFCMFIKAVSRRFSWMGRYPLAFVVALFAGIQINAVAQAELGAQINRAMMDVDSEKVDLNTAAPAEMGRLPGITPTTARKIAEYRKADRIDTLDEVATIPTLSDGERALFADSRGSIKGIDAQAHTGDEGRYWFGIFSNLLLLAGTLSCLLYFYFSLAHKGVVGKVSRFGVWILMIGFGASFGYTVQGRIALAIGRAQDVMGTRMETADADRVQGPIAALVSVAIIIAGIAFWEVRSRRKAGDAPPSGST